MSKVDNILLEKNLNYEKIKEFIEGQNEENYYKILNRINNFDEESKKIICKEVIIRADNENLVDRACMEISTFIKYDYNYYKEIIEEIAEKEYHSTWIEAIKDKLIEDSSITLQYVFEDFSNEVPTNINFDIEIIKRFIDKYDEKHIKDLRLEKEQVIVVCKRLNYIITINLKNVLKIYCCFDNKFKFSENEVEKFLDQFFFDFPYVCKKFIEQNNNHYKELKIIEYLKKRIEKFDKEEKIKFNMEIFHPDKMRINQYRKYQLKQNKEINKKASKYSIFIDLCKSNTILYGKKYGMTVTTKNENKVSVSTLHEFKYECPYALQYIIDPVEYMIRIGSLKNLGKGK